jgi:phosphoribosylaminoimidazolecarboxamide formyltransferase/IMP cyclohydrolase
MTPNTRIKRALISTHDKRDIITLARVLIDFDVEIIATGGTAQLLKAHQIPMTSVEQITQFPEMMGGRVKTLHPAIHAGILARRGIDDSILAEQALFPIDLVIVNLYPFEETVASGASLPEVIEQIDIGGPTLLRAAAKNYLSVTVISSPDYYPELQEQLMEHEGSTTLWFRSQQAAHAFKTTTHYDQVIFDYFMDHCSTAQAKKSNEDALRYGENPQQNAICRIDLDAQPGKVANCKPLQGKALSYNNLVDADAAWTAINAFPTNCASCVIVKHATPCGLACGTTIEIAYEHAFATDKSSAFGGIIAFNQSVDANTAEKIVENQFVEVICAPLFSEQALQIFRRKTAIRLLPLHLLTHPEPECKSISGGLLRQSGLPLDPAADRSNWRVVTQKKPTEEQMQDLIFAWRAIKTVKSNAILYAKNQRTLGIGSGQTSRVFAARAATLKAADAGLDLTGSVCASDAFFPFADGLQVVIDAGTQAVIQPGGSKRDEEVIAAANEAGIVMVMTGERLFRH